MRLEPWIWCMAIFTVWRSLVIIYASIVNDMVFAYHIIMCLFWILFILGNVYAWLVVHSFYHELCEVTRLEDVARVKVCCIYYNLYYYSFSTIVTVYCCILAAIALSTLLYQRKKSSNNLI